MKRRIWKIAKAGHLKNLKLFEDEIHEKIDSNKVRVKICSVGLNFADIFAILGLYSATPKGEFTPGLEACGIVINCGEHIKNLKIGDRVSLMTRFGGMASVIDIDTKYTYRIPDEWSFEQGSSFLVQILTALYALENLGDIKPGMSVLVNSAAGGVGLQAMKLIKFYKARPIGLVGNSTKVKFLNDLGFENVYERDKKLVEKLRTTFSDGFDLFLDAIGGPIQKQIFKLLNPMGRMIVFGAADFTPKGDRPNYITLLKKYLNRPKYDPMTMVNFNKSILAFNLIWLYENQALLEQMMQNLSKITIDPPFVGKLFDFEDVHAAIRYFRTGNSIGKVVLTISD